MCESFGALTHERGPKAFEWSRIPNNVQTNCLTELIPEAIESAKACDRFLARTGNPIGLLHGLPISVKEQISIAGHYTNVGFVSMVSNHSTEDASIVKSLKSLGAVVFARTNQPQSLMQLETSNNVYGATVNPRNRGLTAGGSTGGEGALMAMHGTPLGIGGDIGGSIRVPAALNGVSRRDCGRTPHIKCRADEILMPDLWILPQHWSDQRGRGTRSIPGL